MQRKRSSDPIHQLDWNVPWAILIVEPCMYTIKTTHADSRLGYQHLCMQIERKRKKTLLKEEWGKNSWEIDESESEKRKENKRKIESDLTLWPIFYQTDLLLSFYPSCFPDSRIIAFWKHVHTHTHRRAAGWIPESLRLFVSLGVEQCLQYPSLSQSRPPLLSLSLSLFCALYLFIFSLRCELLFSAALFPFGDMWNEAEMVPQWWRTDKER